MEYLMFIVGLAIGAAMSSIFHHKKIINGTLKIDSSDPDGPYMFLSLSREDMDAIDKKDYIWLKIEDNFSQK